MNQKNANEVCKQMLVGATALFFFAHVARVARPGMSDIEGRIV
ncbi:hypothetical protein [Burkholderia ambifaria]|nr:hypothetical protein [Burkholderia ambifaria]